ncbi:MAG: hypothetical protein KAG84_05020 [Bacteroidales bacterium]|nr:hypothetical protein [Bacteroidales bacterium]
MKKITLLLTALFLFGLTYGQMKYLPSKTVVVILGAQNPHIDYTRFADIEFYFTPELDNLYNDAESMGDVARNSVRLFAKNTNESKQQAVLDAYSGKNDIIYQRSLTKSFLFDKEGIVYGKFWGGTPLFISNDKYLIKNKSQDSEIFKTLLKELVKKGDTRKLGKIKKGKDYSWQPGYAPTSILVTDKDGNSKDIVDLVKGNPATLLYFVHVNSKFDPIPGSEKNNGQDPEDYNNAINRTLTLDKQMEPLYNIEKNIFGKKINPYLK